MRAVCVELRLPTPHFPRAFCVPANAHRTPVDSRRIAMTSHELHIQYHPSVTSAFGAQIVGCKGFQETGLRRIFGLALKARRRRHQTRMAPRCRRVPTGIASTLAVVVAAFLLLGSFGVRALGQQRKQSELCESPRWRPTWTQHGARCENRAAVQAGRHRLFIGPRLACRPEDTPSLKSHEVGFSRIESAPIAYAAPLGVACTGAWRDFPVLGRWMLFAGPAVHLERPDLQRWRRRSGSRLSSPTWFDGQCAAAIASSSRRSA